MPGRSGRGGSTLLALTSTPYRQSDERSAYRRDPAANAGPFGRSLVSAFSQCTSTPSEGPEGFRGSAHGVAAGKELESDFVRFGLISIVAVTLLAARPARAQAQPGDGEWYGWQIALVDVAAAGSIVVWTKLISGKSLADARQATPLLALGGLTYLLGGPLVHGALHHNLAAGRSLMLRLLLPVGLGLLGGYAGGQGVGAAAGAVSGFALGGAAAMAIDWITAREPNPAFSLGAGPRSFTLAMRF